MKCREWLQRTSCSEPLSAAACRQSLAMTGRSSMSPHKRRRITIFWLERVRLRCAPRRGAILAGQAWLDVASNTSASGQPQAGIVLQRKRDGATEPDQPVLEPQRKLCHWSYLLEECAWMSKDIRYERRWRKHMAFIIAHEAVAACDKLRKVSTGRNGAKAASRDVSRYAILNFAI